eukprot:CAMPEP_0196155298 /NCGR_PEP_ID=MMETSP0910-20130528/40389_1 /TAXON_ID=49265 /ORGANISM="Thalassiosira rotula, Strain GSO102" /LENGTH=400 /DNA_ID=CAMNT_0041419485 /DNA_START=124 /DNA_END=1323 /DNA_ORIENTATION=+
MPVSCMASLMLFIASIELATSAFMLAASSNISNTKSIMRMTSPSIRKISFDRIRASSPLKQRGSVATSLKYPSAFYSIRSNRHSKKISTDHCRSFFSTSLSMTSSISHNWEQITNHQTSKTVKLFKTIHRANKAKRSDLGLTVAEGVRLVSDILANEESRKLVRRVVISESLLYDGDNADQYQNQLQHWLHVVDEESRQRKAEYSGDGASSSTVPTCSINVGTEKVVDACSGTVTSQGVVALMSIPLPYTPLDNLAVLVDDDKKVDDEMPPFYLILDGLSDPGNVGTLLRTCAASHVTALILLPGSCDVWNPKAVRSAMGASFTVPVLEIGKGGEKEALNQVLDLLERCGVDNDRVFAATMEDAGDKASLAHYGIDFTSKVGGAAVILGREGEGLRGGVR